MAKRLHQDSGVHRVTAKTQLMLSLIAKGAKVEISHVSMPVEEKLLCLFNISLDFSC